MVRKLLLASAIVIGLIYGTGHDFASLKRSILSASNGNARSMTANDGGGWGPDSGY
jgi:hypothetical protein